MKRILAIILVLALGLSLCAAAEGDFPVTVTDQAGREVTIEREPETIVCGYYIATSMLIALDQDEKLAGIENDADKRPVYALSAPHLLKLPGMGNVKLFDLEACATLDPDLVVLPLRQADTAPTLEELGYTVLFVNPESPELLAQSISLLGAATGSSERAQALNAHIEGALSALEAAIGDAEKPSVYLSGNSSFLKTAGPAMYQHNLIERGCGENVAAELSDTYWAEISYEQLLAWDPEAILMAADASYTAEELLSDPNLQSLRAVESGRVYKLPNAIESWDSPVPASFLGSFYLASVLHPDRFSEQAYAEAVRAFYLEFYGFEPEL